MQRGMKPAAAAQHPRGRRAGSLGATWGVPRDEAACRHLRSALATGRTLTQQSPQHQIIHAPLPTRGSIRRGPVGENGAIALIVNAERFLLFCFIVKELHLLFKYDEKVMCEY